MGTSEQLMLGCGQIVAGLTYHHMVTPWTEFRMTPQILQAITMMRKIPVRRLTASATFL